MGAPPATGGGGALLPRDLASSELSLLDMAIQFVKSFNMALLCCQRSLNTEPSKRGPQGEAVSSLSRWTLSCTTRLSATR